MVEYTLGGEGTKEVYYRLYICVSVSTLARAADEKSIVDADLNQLQLPSNATDYAPHHRLLLLAKLSPDTVIP